MRERGFVVAYVGEAAGNATKAAILAGYSPKSARFQGSKLTAKRYIKHAIATLRNTAAAELEAQTAAATERAAIADLQECLMILTDQARQRADGHLAVKAIGQIDKLLGWSAKHAQRLEVTERKTIDWTRLSDAELELVHATLKSAVIAGEVRH